MSYTRWGNSSWYSFYSDSDSSERNDQVLALWYSTEQDLTWSYEELSHVMKQSDDNITDFFIRYYHCTEDEAREAKTIVGWFMADVEEDCPMGVNEC